LAARHPIHTRGALLTSASTLVALVLLVLAAPSRAACPNEALRVEASHALPRCRAYEQVSPARAEPEFLYPGARTPETGAPVEGKGSAKQVQASAGGDRFSYVTTYPPSGSPSDGQYLRVARGSDGWVSEEMIPPQSTHYSDVCRSGYIAAYSPELASAILGDGLGQPGSTLSEGNLECGTDDPQLVPGEPEGFQNLFLTEGEPGPYQLVDEIGRAPGGFSPAGAWFEAASEDLSHVVFVEAAQLTPEAPAVTQAAELTKKSGEPLPDLYEWTSRNVRLVTVLPDGTPVAGSLANGFLPEGLTCCGGAETFTHAVSADGSRVFFQAGGDLYLRLNAEQPQSPIHEETCTVASDACTLQVDAGQGGPEAGGGSFAWATPDGTRVFFLDERRLTGESTAAAGSPDLYEYDSGAPPGERLRDLTAHAGEHADVLGVSGISEDGEYAYFVARAKLVAEQNSVGATAVAGEPNLYLAHEGETTFIATLSASPDEADWDPTVMTSRVTPSGSFIAFNSAASLTGYDNVDVVSKAADDEIFLFDAATDTLSCASCSPTGAPSTGYAKIPAVTQPIFGGGAPPRAAGYLQRSLADDGRVFFSTPESLSPRASDGQSNVYEYEYDAETKSGELNLISSGTSPDPSYFYDASASGNDVFFITSQELPSGASASEFRVYDAREDGGFATSPAPAGCSGEGCRTPTSPLSAFAAPATEGTLVSGNLSPPASSAPKPPKSAAQVRREELARALAKCRKLRDKHKRASCEARAHRRYGAKSTVKKSTAKKSARAGGRGR
jgi:hypothetical protein